MPDEQWTAASLARAVQSRARVVEGADLNTWVRDRFLCRVFQEPGEWLLKGGAMMLSRIGSARATRDVDLLRPNSTLDEALEELCQLVAVDLGDHCRYEYLGTRPMVARDRQAGRAGCRVTFSARIGVAQKDDVKVDLVVGDELHGDVEVRTPENRVEVPAIDAVPYQLYPVVDQIADKLCAMMGIHVGGRQSSREKDLIDLVILARTVRIPADSLTAALQFETRRRGVTVDRVIAPRTWGPAYRREARQRPHCKDHQSVADAIELIAALVEPALNGRAVGWWEPDQLRWMRHTAQL